jgi:hypothetical protein
MRQVRTWVPWLLGALLMIISFVLGRSLPAPATSTAVQIAVQTATTESQNDQLGERDLQLSQIRQNLSPVVQKAVVHLDQLSTDAATAAHIGYLTETTRLLREIHDHARDTGGLLDGAIGTMVVPDLGNYAPGGFTHVLMDYGGYAQDLADRLEAQGEILDADKDHIRLLQNDLQRLNLFVTQTDWLQSTDASRLTAPLSALCREMRLRSPSMGRLGVDATSRAACVEP